MTQLSITEVQEWLARFGYYDGPIDGNYMEPEFRTDLKKFQRDYRSKAGAADGWYGPKSESALLPLVDKFKQAECDLTAAGVDIKSMRRWQLTYYYIGDQSRWSGPEAYPMFGSDGSVIATVEAGCFVEAALEGTTKLRDGRLINVADGSYISVDPSDWTGVYSIIKANGWLHKPNWGGVSLTPDQSGVDAARRFYEKPASPETGYPVEAKGIPMDPFRSLAADNGRMRHHDPSFKGKGGVVPAGTKVFILEFVGKTLPDGTVHDGWFTVNDTGGGIYGAHFDVFTGSREWGDAAHIPERGHIWFEGIEDCLSINYSYGLA
jgi:peptidoglycan hydrolase-like protein with peptidoglycan-binding domain